jgi:hypothetical protein
MLKYAATCTCEPPDIDKPLLLHLRGVGDKARNSFTVKNLLIGALKHASSNRVVPPSAARSPNCRTIWSARAGQHPVPIISARLVPDQVAGSEFWMRRSGCCFPILHGDRHEAEGVVEDVPTPVRPRIGVRIPAAASRERPHHESPRPPPRAQRSAVLCEHGQLVKMKRLSTPS